MKVGIVISTNDAETCWNALRFANFCLGKKDEVSLFLMGKGVEYQKVSNDQFNTVKQTDKYIENGGQIFACGTCIKSREQSQSAACPISTMQDMYDLVQKSDKVVTF